jgi:iron-sulfur cluster assembly enzyme ISCU, mitochondrial
MQRLLLPVYRTVLSVLFHTHQPNKNRRLKKKRTCTTTRKKKCVYFPLSHTSKNIVERFRLPQKMLGRINSSVVRRALPHGRRASVRLYHENVIDHYENPRNVGSLDKKSKRVGTGLVGAPACGDVMKLQFEVDDNGVIVDAKFKTFGCGSAIASSSVATEWLKGRNVDDCLSIKVILVKPSFN